MTPETLQRAAVVVGTPGLRETRGLEGSPGVGEPHGRVAVQGSVPSDRSPLPLTQRRLGALAHIWGQREAAADHAGARSLPPATVADIRACGILAGPIPETLGGAGWSLLQSCEAVRTVARHAPATALALAMPLGNAATACIPDEAVAPAQRAALAQGRVWTAQQCLAGRILAVANSEPGSGGDMANTKATAELRDGTWHLTGRKAFATFGSDADEFLCAARTGGAVEGFFVARQAAGLTVGEDWDGAGMRTSASVTLQLDGARASAFLGYPGALAGANARHWSTLLFGAVFVGVAEGALQEAAKVAERRSATVRATLAQHALQVQGAAAFVERVALADHYPFQHTVQAQRAKTFAAQAAVGAATAASTLGGGRSYRDGHPVAKFLRDAMAGPHLRPPMAQVLDGLADEWLGPL